MPQIKPNKQIRSANKAVIIHDGRLLVLRKEDKHGTFYILPGGGQEHGETAEEGLIRECIEEVSVKVIPGKLLFVRDYISENHGIPEDIAQDLHQVELMFHCSIAEGEPANGAHTDDGQLSVDWIDIKNIDELRLYPAAIKQYLGKVEDITHTIYLGDVN